MKKVTDLTRSKNPISVEDVEERDALMVERQSIDQNIGEIIALREVLLKDSEYSENVQWSIARLHQLVSRMLTIPLNEKTLDKHNQIRGQISECWDMIRRALGLRECIQGLQRRKLTLGEKISSISEQMEKRAEKGR